VIASAIKEVAVRTGQAPLVVVDYLQKVCEPEGNDENEKITRITERLKDLSIEFGCPVLAVAAADREGLEPGSRMRARHMRGSTALAYEPDLVLVLNTKSDIVARHHLVYDGEAASRFRDWSVLTIEKNRSGHDGAELEFRKRFEQGRFETVGKAVSETLVDERVFTE
jgi:replicative DNA helicase